MASLDVYTYQDAVDQVLDLNDTERSTRADRLALRAVQRAYRNFPNKHRWAYYERRGKIHTITTQTTGTVTYDHTGGTYERELTLSGATWPTDDDVRVYKVIIGQHQYDIEDKKSSTVVTLSATNNPGEDVAAGTSYTLYKSRFNLPINFRKMVTPLMDLGRSYVLTEVPLKQFLEHMSGNWQPQEPNVYAIHNAGEYYGSWILEMAPPPNQARTWDYIYEASPRPLKVEKYATGTVTTDGTTTVTGSGTAWTAKHVGAIIRVPLSGTTEPGGIVGTLDDSSGNAVEPFDEQRSIVSVETATSLTVDTAISTRSGVAHTISDPLDMEPGKMVEAFLSLCEAYYARFIGREDRRDWEEEARMQLREAMSADNRQREIQWGGSGGDKSAWGLREWAINEAYGGTVIDALD